MTSWPIAWRLGNFWREKYLVWLWTNNEPRSNTFVDFRQSWRKDEPVICATTTRSTRKDFKMDECHLAVLMWCRLTSRKRETSKPGSLVLVGNLLLWFFFHFTDDLDIYFTKFNYFFPVSFSFTPPTALHHTHFAGDEKRKKISLDAIVRSLIWGRLGGSFCKSDARDPTSSGTA